MPATNVVGAICCHHGDVFVLGDLVEQVRQGGAVAVPRLGVNSTARMSEVSVSMSSASAVWSRKRLTPVASSGNSTDETLPTWGMSVCLTAFRTSV